MNPTAPSIKGLIKLHKTEHPIRPVVNWRGAPVYKLARLLSQKNRQLAPLPNRSNLESTTDLIKTLKDTPVLPQFTVASLDITNPFTNIPVTEMHEVLANALENNLLDSQTREELIRWYDTITQQN
jgi:hypothetical protein